MRPLVACLTLLACMAVRAAPHPPPACLPALADAAPVERLEISLAGRWSWVRAPHLSPWPSATISGLTVGPGPAAPAFSLVVSRAAQSLGTALPLRVGDGVDLADWHLPDAYALAGQWSAALSDLAWHARRHGTGDALERGLSVRYEPDDRAVLVTDRHRIHLRATPGAPAALAAQVLLSAGAPSVRSLSPGLYEGSLTVAGLERAATLFAALDAGFPSADSAPLAAVAWDFYTWGSTGSDADGAIGRWWDGAEHHARRSSRFGAMPWPGRALVLGAGTAPLLVGDWPLGAPDAAGSVVVPAGLGALWPVEGCMFADAKARPRGWLLTTLTLGERPEPPRLALAFHAAVPPEDALLSAPSFDAPLVPGQWWVLYWSAPRGGTAMAVWARPRLILAYPSSRS